MSFTCVIDPSYSPSDYTLLDLSAENDELLDIDLDSSSEIAYYLNSLKTKRDKKVFYGGYLEKRLIYSRSEHFSKTNRNIHLGLDLWIDEGTQVLACADGVIHSFRNNIGFGNYGPTIILYHSDLNMHTLYGHLSADSISTLSIGKVIRKGETIGRLGGPEVNGDYAPHLHFQLIKQMGNYHGDYPGVANQKELEFYKENCPDPGHFLGLY